MTFADRDDAGRRLAARLRHLRGEPVVLLSLPPGDVPVASQVARALGAPLDVIIVRKLGVPFQPELGMDAVGEDGMRVIHLRIVHAAGVPDNELAAVRAREQAAVEARAVRYRVRRPRQPLDGRIAVVVDDGIELLRVHGPGRLPDRPGAGGGAGRAATPQSRHKPAPRAPRALLTRRPGARKSSPAPGSSAWPGTWPCRRTRGIVVFAHGSGSSRHSPCNRYVAAS